MNSLILRALGLKLIFENYIQKSKGIPNQSSVVILKKCQFIASVAMLFFCFVVGFAQNKKLSVVQTTTNTNPLTAQADLTSVCPDRLSSQFRLKDNYLSGIKSILIPEEVYIQYCYINQISSLLIS